MTEPTSATMELDSVQGPGQRTRDQNGQGAPEQTETTGTGEPTMGVPDSSTTHEREAGDRMSTEVTLEQIQALEAVVEEVMREVAAADLDRAAAAV